MTATECVNEYFSLMCERPELFAASELIDIVTDREEILRYCENSGKRVGVVHKSGYYLHVVDLIRQGAGYYLYERMVTARRERGCVCIPLYRGNFVLIRQFRHALRDFQLCFPRGFGESGLSSSENAAKELSEEIGASCESATVLGSVAADSGILGGCADVVLCEISSYDKPCVDEGICSVIEFSRHELRALIARGEITDGFTLAALALFDARYEA